MPSRSTSIRGPSARDKNLRPARDTCEECHWPQSFVGNLDRTFNYFQSDASNSPYSIRLLLKIGGSDPRQGPVGGIHWHNLPATGGIRRHRRRAPENSVGACDRRQWQGHRFQDEEFHQRHFQNGTAHDGLHGLSQRPSHRYLSPEKAVNQQMALGHIDPSIPWIKTNAVYILTRPYKRTMRRRPGSP